MILCFTALITIFYPMKRRHACIAVLSLFTFYVQAQVYDDDDLRGTKYLEDQFYFGLGYNFLLNKPEDVIQRSLSYNLQTGYIKDIPLNEKRNVALGIGLGYGVNSYYTNLVATKNAGVITYNFFDGEGFRRSKFETHAIELPFEFRWRTSTDLEYKFWRIYVGFKLAYLFARTSKLVTDDISDSFSNDDIQDLQYGIMLNFGFNTWNIHAYYGLNPLLKENVTLENGDALELRALRIGVIFYIL